MTVIGNHRILCSNELFRIKRTDCEVHNLYVLFSFVVRHTLQKVRTFAASKENRGAAPSQPPRGEETKVTGTSIRNAGWNSLKRKNSKT